MTPALDAAFRAAERLPEAEQTELAQRILADVVQRDDVEDEWIAMLTAPLRRQHVALPIPLSRR